MSAPPARPPASCGRSSGTRDGAPLLLEFIAYGAREPTVRADLAARLLKLPREAISALIAERFAAAGVEAPLPVEQLAIAVTALANGLVIERVFDPEVPPGLLGEAISLLLDARLREDHDPQ